jgi:flagellar biosynthesis/type III secretory pathway M-ring protein FliF/YscJ
MDNDERLLGRPNKPRRDWLGVRDKTAWDWLSLLIVPLFIVIATVVATAVLNYFETERENKRAEALRQADRERAQTQQQIEDDRVRQSVLQSYIQDMTELLLDRGLATSEHDQPIRDIARSSTLTAVR